MTQTEKIQNIIDAFKANGMTLTLGQLVKIDACEYRKWVSKIRTEHPGYDIPPPKLDQKHPSNNLYTLIEINSKPSKNKTTYTMLNTFATTYTTRHSCFKCCQYYRAAEEGKKCQIC